MTYIKCPYCEWHGQGPNRADFDTDEEFIEAIENFYLGHAKQCPGPYAEVKS